MLELGYDIAWGSLVIACQDEKPEWRFVAVALGKNRGTTLTDMAQLFTSFEGVEQFQLSHARN